MARSTRARALDLEERIALGALQRCESEPRFWPFEDIENFVREVSNMLAASDLDPLDDIEAVLFTTGRARELSMNAFRVKLQNALRIGHNMIAACDWVRFGRQDPEPRIRVEWTLPSGRKRSEQFALDKIENIVDRVLSLSTGERVASSMGLSFQTPKAKWG